MARFKNWMNNVAITDMIAFQQALLFQWMLIGIIVASLLAIPIGSSLASTPSGQIAIATATALLVPCAAFAWYMLRQGNFYFSVLFITLGWELCLGVYLVVLGLASSGPILLILALPVTLAGLLIRQTGLLIALGCELFIVLLVAALESLGSPFVGFAPPHSISVVLVVPAFLLGIGLLSTFLYIFTGSLRIALHTALEREHELKQVRSAQADIIESQTTDLRTTLEVVQQQKAELSQTVQEMAQQQSVINALSAPILPVLPGVLVVPFTGAIDQGRADTVQQNVLHKVAQQHIRFVIFDVTGILYMDASVANGMMRSANALRLLGASVILVGIRPEVAQTLTSLEFSFEGIPTYANLQEAVQRLARQRL